MSLKEALKKSNRNGRKNVRWQVQRALIITFCGIAFLYILTFFNIIQTDIVDVFMDNLPLGIWGAVALLASTSIAYITGFSEMFRKYRNTGKLGELALVIAGLGVFFALIPTLGVDVGRSNWYLTLGLILLAVGAAFWGNQRRRREFSS